jgi:hypothetical protein
MQSGVENHLILVSASASIGQAFTSQGELGTAAVLPNLAPGIDTFPTWTTDHVMPVVAGTTYTAGLYAKHAYGTPTEYCSGALNITVY